MNECKCDYCGNAAKLVGGNVIYPHRQDLADLKFWVCDPCGAYVGCHKKGARIGRSQVSDGTVPLGRLANAELRTWKSKAHAAFDPLWREGGMARGAAYSWLAGKMGIHQENCHFGMFNVDQCVQAVEICNRETDKRLAAEFAARWGMGAAA